MIIRCESQASCVTYVLCQLIINEVFPTDDLEPTPHYIIQSYVVSRHCLFGRMKYKLCTRAVELVRSNR